MDCGNYADFRLLEVYLPVLLGSTYAAADFSKIALRSGLRMIAITALAFAIAPVGDMVAFAIRSPAVLKWDVEASEPGQQIEVGSFGALRAAKPSKGKVSKNSSQKATASV